MGGYPEIIFLLEGRIGGSIINHLASSGYWGVPYANPNIWECIFLGLVRMELRVKAKGVGISGPQKWG